MGRIVPFPGVAEDYPATTDGLNRAESLLLLGIRWWVVDYRQGADPLPRLCAAMDQADAHDAAFSVDRLLAVVARTARHPVAVHCPRCPHLSADELQLLHAASLVQSGDSALAERALRTALLSATGAEYALGPLEGLAELFTEARLLLRRRLSPHAADAVRWTPGEQAGTLH